MILQCRGACVAVMLAALAGCGGGGGASGGDAGGGPPATTGLVPAAPTPGATLYADASVLRPLHEGATWTYQGTVTASGGADPVGYLTVTTQTGVSATGATETASNSVNAGADTYQLVVTGGTVSERQFVDLTGHGMPGDVTLTELRSPVRTNDQFTSFDQRLADAGIDLDGDGSNEALDVAVYSRIVGPERLDLPNRPGQPTVHVITTALARAILSGNGQPTPVVQETADVWYAEGIGIVRQRVTLPDATGTGVETYDEQLLSWTGF